MGEVLSRPRSCRLQNTRVAWLPFDEETILTAATRHMHGPLGLVLAEVVAAVVGQLTLGVPWPVGFAW